MVNRLAQAFRGARMAQKEVDEVNPFTDEYAHWLELFTALQNSARREFDYTGCIHGPKKECPPNTVILCDHCIKQEGHDD